LITVIFALIFSVFLSSFIAEFLTDKEEGLDFDKKNVGYFMSLWAAMYTIAAFMIGPISKKVNIRLISFFSYIIIALGCFLLGPSRVLDIDTWREDKADCLAQYPFILDPRYVNCVDDARETRTNLMVIALIVLGTGAGTVVVPILLELVTSVKDALGVMPGANEKASGLFTMCSAVGTILGPMAGGILYDNFGVQTTCDIFGLTSVSMAVIYFIMNVWPALLIKKKKDPQQQADDSKKILILP
jgi:MFS family permease